MGAVCGVVGRAWGIVLCWAGGWNAFWPPVPLSPYAQGNVLCDFSFPIILKGSINQGHTMSKHCFYDFLIHRETLQDFGAERQSLHMTYGVLGCWQGGRGAHPAWGPSLSWGRGAAKRTCLYIIVHCRN